MLRKPRLRAAPGCWRLARVYLIRAREWLLREQNGPFRAVPGLASVLACSIPMNLRRLAERASRGVVLKKKLPVEFSRLPMYVTPQSGLRYWRSLAKVDPLLCRTASELVHPGAVVWDVGANVGLFTFCAAALAGASGSVLAIEPDTWLTTLLMRSALAVRNSNAANVRVLCAAVSDRNKIAELEIADRGRAANHLSDS